MNEQCFVFMRELPQIVGDGAGRHVEPVAMRAVSRVEALPLAAIWASTCSDWAVTIGAASSADTDHHAGIAATSITATSPMRTFIFIEFAIIGRGRHCATSSVVSLRKQSEHPERSAGGNRSHSRVAGKQRVGAAEAA